MMPWFVWKNKNSLSDFGLWISKLPNRTRPEERHEEIEIPGRAGTLTLLEGEDVYPSYVREVVVTARNTLNINGVLEWLTGSGDIVFSNEPDFAYEAQILGEVSFARVGNCLMQATIPFLCKPFKKKSAKEASISASANTSKTVFNPGNVSSKPKITFTAYGNQTITVNGVTLTLNNMPGGETIVDCENHIILVYAQPYNPNMHYYVGEYATISGDVYWPDGLYKFLTEGVGSEQEWEQVSWDGQPYQYAWPGRYSGDYPVLKKGGNTVLSSMAISIDPCWRWKG